MGNYHNLEIDFVERTLKLIDQYEELLERYSFHEQYTHTLLTNCLLGLIILPKEKSFTYIPNERIALVKTLNDWGISKSIFNPNIKYTTELFQRLRNAVAHFDIQFISETNDNLIDKIKFIDSEAGIEVAIFDADEFSQFIRFYATTLLENLKKKLLF